ncbi:MAG TPA: branched-chain amino acid ABC transporter permease [Paracoccus solventivorans]|uniref:branched-chain amino acid ABC transporter permease n=1 Tax=Paracoccus solventivorans TaxID=53463 RepID=UPI002BD32D0B|nr:branched-chain amino acid ABC transporter permease [Paracoccus solventivorans]HMM08219.1 branched-chain amino acid ABC transporter permease [Paracoccus solventivorans]
MVELLLSGITLGAIYALLAAGLTLAYGVTRIFNWAYGSTFTWAGFFLWIILVRLGLPYAVAIPLLLMAAFAFGYGFELAIIRPLRRKREWQTTTMLATLGVAMVMDNLAMWVLGPQRKTLPLMMHGSVLKIGGINVSYHDIVIIVVGVLSILLLDIFLRHSWTGLRMRAISQDQDGARMVGIRHDRVFATAFALSTVLAAIAALLITPKTSVTIEGGWQVFIKAFVVVSFAGMGNVRGVLLAAFILGAIEALVTWYLGSLWVYVYWLASFLLLTLFRPQGLIPSRYVRRQI